MRVTVTLPGFDKPPAIPFSLREFIAPTRLLNAAARSGSNKTRQVCASLRLGNRRSIFICRRTAGLLGPVMSNRHCAPRLCPSRFLASTIYGAELREAAWLNYTARIRRIKSATIGCSPYAHTFVPRERFDTPSDYESADQVFEHSSSSKLLTPAYVQQQVGARNVGRRIVNAIVFHDEDGKRVPRKACLQILVCAKPACGASRRVRAADHEQPKALEFQALQISYSG